MAEKWSVKCAFHIQYSPPATCMLLSSILSSIYDVWILVHTSVCEILLLKDANFLASARSRMVEGALLTWLSFQISIRVICIRISISPMHQRDRLAPGDQTEKQQHYGPQYD